MDRVLGELIAEAPAQLRAVARQEEQGLAKQESAAAAGRTSMFKQRMEAALGSEVLASLGPLSYGADAGLQAMTFQVKGRGFELRQAIGSYVNLLTGGRELFQFNLSNPEAKDRFLVALGEALASPA